MIEGNSNSIDTIFNWYKKLRIQTYYIMINTRASKIGGIGHVVEVDEAKFSKRKYEIDRIVRSAWVVGRVNLTTGKTFFVKVFYRNKHTLSQVLLENIEEGTIVVTDCWAGYVNLDSLEFIHYTVNHSLNFVDPITGANTQAIENHWSVLKRKLSARFVTSRSDLCFYFAEFIFKSKFKILCFIKIMEILTSFDYILLNSTFFIKN
ncbi:hypothetical protein H312_03477 [Anncaliia algerae PRA339]|uniref:ISXO2-like transposase domain-containing protein n=1 Tax=Anncaliia algerae PRA339 TaxID=1288291 RepID=A0A059EW57_9MICR|nr:hypothetical protein H312_03477 [Anncaliia algerae PRA339]